MSVPNEIERLFDTHEALQLIALTEDDDLMLAAKFLAMKEKKWTMQQIADALGYASRQSSYELEWRLEASGALEKARRYFLIPALKEVNAAIQEVFNDWPDIIRGVNEMAKTTPDQAKRLAAVEWLREHVIQPVMESSPHSDSAEQAYISGDYSFQPTDLPKPKFLKHLPRGAAS